MLSLAKRNVAVYIPTTSRPSSKIFEFFGISPSESPTSSLRRLLNGQGTRLSTPVIFGPDAFDSAVGEDGVKQSHADEKGWSHAEAYKDHKTRRALGCLKAFIKGFGTIWFAIPINAGLIGLLLRQILLHVLIPSDLVHTTVHGDGRSRDNVTTGIDIKASIWNSTHPFRGQRALQTTSTVLFFIDLVLFAIFSFVFLLRLVWFRRRACREVLEIGHHQDHPAIETGLDENPGSKIVQPPKHKTNPGGNDVGYLSLWSITWLTLVAFAVAIIPEIESNPSTSTSVTKLTLAAYITWWIGAAWTIITTLITLSAVILPRSSTSPSDRTPNLQATQRIPPSILFPSFALATIAVIGSLLVSNLLMSSHASSPTNNTSTALTLPNLAMIPVLIFSFCAIGASLFLAVILYPVLLFQQFFTPKRETTCTQLALTLFFFVGPISQCAAGLQLLGGALSAIPGGGDEDSGNGGLGYDIAGAAFLTNTAPTLISVPCILLALLLFGLAVVWFLLALVVTGSAVARREMRWSMDWHAVILSLAALGLSALMFGAELDSGFFRVVACVLLVVVVVGFLVNIGFTVWFVVKGDV